MGRLSEWESIFKATYSIPNTEVEHSQVGYELYNIYNSYIIIASRNQVACFEHSQVGDQIIPTGIIIT